jgi:hypothetical protein
LGTRSPRREVLVSRLLLPIFALALLAGCNTARARDPAWGTFARPGDAERATVLPPRRGEPLPEPTGDPLPARVPGDWRAEDPAGFGQPRAGLYLLRQPPASANPMGPWSIDGPNLALPLDQMWRVRIGFSAGGPDLEADDDLDSPRRAFVVSPGFCLECDF